MLAEAEIRRAGEPDFVPLDFEHHTLAEGLAEAGFDARGRRFSAGWGWCLISRSRHFARPVTRLRNCRRNGGELRLRAFAGDAGSAGTHGIRQAGGTGCGCGRAVPAFLYAGDWSWSCAAPGFSVEQLDYEQINERYFKDRADGLKLHQR
jgi:hypothetical protein